MALVTKRDDVPLPLRVLLWSIPRSLSTVFLKCMSFVPNTLVINEPFVCACLYGPEKITAGEKMFETLLGARYKKSLAEVNVKLPMAFESDDCTYAFVKETLEADYPGKRLIFCKDMADSLNARYDVIPQGYRHTFITRHPYRMLSSWKKVMVPYMAAIEGKDNFLMCDLPASRLPKGYLFQEQYDLMTYFRAHGEPDPIIIDADDLLENPASILRQYCTLLGIPYTDDLLKWPAGKDVVKSWKGSRDILLGNFHEWGGYYETALNSTGFHPPKDMPRREDLSEDILECADFCMPYYQKMYDLRIRP